MGKEVVKAGLDMLSLHLYGGSEGNDGECQWGKPVSIPKDLNPGSPNTKQEQWPLDDVQWNIYHSRVQR
jgi:hypothetical protein